MKTKIISPQKLKLILKTLQKRGKKIVFTNGCFDILHAGHVRYLKQAKKLGDILVLALNSDGSVRKIKGMNRPIVPQKERAEIVSSLEDVDFVTFFHEKDPYRIISFLKPNILVKGGDWKKNEIIGADIVVKNGGKIKVIPYLKGKSTTNIIQKIIRNYSDKF